ncbi:MAG: GlsB/YeaQ/YmgE family stress response membrane protein [Candidatus Obscuribacter sp.]|nr:GlsB/YeaQ/YmgE family stress response membrane protein [Candidatus Melainabacteria bacterium]MDX1986862.1 GlsB/YeaQ/YmgE family stress response membrane protein [Candidatus Obscuribacter sp.]
MDFFHFCFYLIVSAVCAGLAARVLPGSKVKERAKEVFSPAGFLSKAVVGIIGAWLGEMVLGPIGPSLEGVRLVPAVVGSVFFVLALSLVSLLVSKIVAVCNLPSLIKGRQTSR